MNASERSGGASCPGGAPIGRRAAMIGAAAGIGALAAPARLVGQAPPPVDGAIDAHCHFFNSSDIPLRGFVEQAFLQAYDYGGSGGWRSLAAVVADAFGGVAPTAFEEGSGPTCRLPSDRGGAGGLSLSLDIEPRVGDPAAPREGGDAFEGLDAPQPERLRRRDDDALAERLAGAIRRLAGPEGDDMAPLEDRRALLRRLGARIEPLERRREDRDGRGGLSGGALEGLGGRVAPREVPQSPLDERRARRLADQMLGLRGDAFEGLSGLGDLDLAAAVSWARTALSSRAELIARYLSLYQATPERPHGVVMATPALVDLDAWLNDSADRGSSLACQVETASALYRSQPIPIHGLIGFDPWRAATDGGASFELVRAAIEDMGFVGVKLYPAMGFRPAGNAGAGDAFVRIPASFDDGPAFARALDETLRRLFTWCSERSVPIITHAVNSYGAGPGYSERARPSQWADVAAAHPALRVCLAHFGNVGRDESPVEQAFRAEWNRGFEVAIRSSRGIYADLSYNPGALNPGGERYTETVVFLRGVLSRTPQAHVRLLFGTDWLLLGLDPGHATYLDGFERLAADVFATETARRAVRRENAARWLGLRPGDPQAARLRRYYQTHGLDFDRLRAIVGG